MQASAVSSALSKALLDKLGMTLDEYKTTRLPKINRHISYLKKLQEHAGALDMDPETIELFGEDSSKILDVRIHQLTFDKLFTPGGWGVDENSEPSPA